MAPNRKKKKLAGNPARGFATTSIVSKSKVEDTVASDDVTEPETEIIAQTPTVTAKVATNGQRIEKELHELTPDELELRLEESELQLLVEKYAEKSNKDSSRQASRLQTERRLLRMQALPLHTSRWLPEELLQQNYDYTTRDTAGSSFPPELANARKRIGTSTDDLSIRLWTLKRTLLHLGFLQIRADEAIAHLIHAEQTMDGANMTAGKDGIWGLEECMDWLALTCTRDELPDYDTHRTEAIEKSIRDSARPPVANDLSTPDTTPSLSRAETPNGTQSGQGSSVQNAPSNTEQQSLSDSGDIPDDDLEPYEVLSRYLQLKTRLYKRRPDLTLPNLRAAKALRVKAKVVTATNDSIDPVARGILNRLKKIESDILFDQEEAEEKWVALRISLVKDVAARKKLGIDDEVSGRPKLVDGAQNPEANLFEPTDGVAAAEKEDPSIDLEDLFAGLPEYKFDDVSGLSGMVSTGLDGKLVNVRDFGNWSGISPRRVLDDACKARDSSSKVSYSVLSSSSFSYRHSLLVRWSRDQDVPVPTSIAGSVCQSDSRHVKVEMVDISCPSSVQAEAYVSTIALFAIFSGSPKEEKTHLRLPPTWKDLWNEMALARKDELAASDCEELRSIRKLVDAAEAESVTKQAGVFARERPKAELKAEDDRIVNIQRAEEDTDSQALKALWSSRSSSRSYADMLKSRMTLPIWNFRDELLTAIDNNQVVILVGDTGCGKSTQAPAFILQNELSNGRDCKIYCTEPRRISAISLARRVSEELGERKNDVGTTRSLVGYAIRLESHITLQTRLVYATTGIIMRMLEGGNGLQDITHLVLDEVHERTIDSDFLLIVLRKLMIRRPGLKVVLMSATVNAEKFSAYLDGAPVLNVPGRTFPVKTMYLEDAIEATNYGKSKGSAIELHEEEDEEDVLEHNAGSSSKLDLQGYSARTLSTLSQFDEYRIDLDLVTRLLATIARSAAYTEYSKAILVFLPGIAEIRRMNDMLVGHPSFSHGWLIYPLHSSIATDEQEKAFLVPPKGIRKIVLATNIAETGITIPDVTCVIDTGKHKEMRFDERRQLSRLIESFISRANAKQRRGRAGRVQNGLCFHLFTKARHDTLMAEQQTPEMLRLSLQDLVLRIKICKLGSIEQTLSEALDPPVPKNIRRAIDALIDVKALTTGEDLTALGRQLAKLPLDVFLGKLVLLGSLFRCLDAAVTIAAILSSKSPFSAPMGARTQADLARLAYKKGDSDLLTVYNAYCAWKRVCQHSGSSEYQFCRKNFLSPQTLSNIEDLKVQLTSSLVEAGFLVLDEPAKAALNRARFYSTQRQFVELPAICDANTTNNLVLNSVIAWSFYPKILAREGKGWRNVANNQTVSLYPTSVNKGASNPPKWLSFYHIMQGSNKFYNAHETSAVEDFPLALVCGDADFKMYSGVIIIDGNRLRFSVGDWKVMLAIKTLRVRIREIMAQFYRSPGKPLSPQQEDWYDVWQRMFSQEWLLKEI